MTEQADTAAKASIPQWELVYRCICCNEFRVGKPEQVTTAGPVCKLCQEKMGS